MHTYICVCVKIERKCPYKAYEDYLCLYMPICNRIGQRWLIKQFLKYVIN